MGRRRETFRYATRLARMPSLSIEASIDLAQQALQNAGASSAMAQTTAKALVAAETEGLSGHGLSRVSLYCQHLREGRAKGDARVTVVRERASTCLFDAGGGLAYEAMAIAVSDAIVRAHAQGLAFVGVRGSHHFGAAAYHLTPLAAAGLVGLAFTNSPAAINAWGGKRPFYGTNPIAAIFPRRDAAPIVIDLSLTEVVRGKIMLYAKEGKPIPLGWALDRDGKPTTDARAALTGSLAAIGGVKGTMLALMVELLCVALTGAAFSFENDSYFEPGGKPDIGHALFAVNPAALAGSDTYFARVEALVDALLGEEGVRLPGARRQLAATRAAAEGVSLSDALHRELLALAGRQAV